MFILFNPVVQTQVLPTTNVLWLRLAILLKKVTLSLTVHLWKVEKWPRSKPYRRLHDMGRLQPRGCRYRGVSVLKDDVYTSVHSWKSSNQKHAIQSLG